jgi:hypothetical protein
MGDRSGRWWWVATGITLLVWALQIFSGVSDLPWIGAVVVALVALGLSTIVAALLPSGVLEGSIVGKRWPSSSIETLSVWWREHGRARAVAVAPWCIAVAVVAAFVVWSFLQVRLDPAYSTDEVAFDQYAATLAMHGENPYVHSMAPSFNKYHLSPNGATFRLNGSVVTALSYPALSFELYLPFLALGWSSQLAIALNVISWAVAMLLLFGMLPKPIRASALVILSLSTYAGYAVGGITDALYVPFLLGAAYFWHRSATGRSWAWVSPILLGISMAIKQSPWLILPFALIGIAMEYRWRQGRWGVMPACRYLGLVLAAFLIPNIPYLIWSPHAWLNGVLTPFLSHTIPAGQGLIGLSLFLHIGGGLLSGYSLATVVALLSLGAVYATSYPLLRGWTFVVPSLILFFATRSFGSYLVMLAPVAYLAVASTFADQEAGSAMGGGIPAESQQVRGPLQSRSPWHYWPAVVAAAFAATGAAVALALGSASPMQVRVIGVHTTGQLATVERITVDVRNTSHHKLRPSFTVETGGVITAFWSTYKSGATLRPGQHEIMTLLSPNFGAQPSIGGGFSVVAFSSNPDAVSTSAVYLPTTWHVEFAPDAVAKAVAFHQPVTIHAQLLDRFDRPVRVSRVPVYLGQIIYDQHGLINSSAIVNGSAPGQTPVRAYTNAQGVATFVIQGTELNDDPVYFLANLQNPHQLYPYGYSDILQIRFGTSP